MSRNARVCTFAQNPGVTRWSFRDTGSPAPQPGPSVAETPGRLGVSPHLTPPMPRGGVRAGILPPMPRGGVRAGILYCRGNHYDCQTGSGGSTAEGSRLAQCWLVPPITESVHTYVMQNPCRHSKTLTCLPQPRTGHSLCRTPSSISQTMQLLGSSPAAWPAH